MLYIDPDGMDWYTHRLSGNQKWIEGDSWKLMYSHNDGGSYMLPELTVKTYSKETIQDFADSYRFEQDLNKMGSETYRTDSRLEAFASWVSLGSLPEFGKLFKSGISAVDDLVKGSNTTRRANPANLARGWQGKGTYPGIDNWRNITLSDGKYVVGGLPGQSNYYTTLNGLSRSSLGKNNFFQGLQVSKHPQFGYRGQVGIYRVNGNTPAAFGTTYANPQFGPGGLPQIFVPNYSGLQLMKKIQLK